MDVVLFATQLPPPVSLVCLEVQRGTKKPLGSTRPPLLRPPSLACPSSMPWTKGSSERVREEQEASLSPMVSSKVEVAILGGLIFTAT